MTNKRKNTLIFSIEVSIYSILFLTFLALNFVKIDKKIVNIIYILFMALSFTWLFLSGFIFNSTDNAVHTKMFKKDYVPTPASTITKKDYKRKNLFVVIILWIIYLLCIGLVKIFGLLTWQLFLMGACIMFILNSIFTRKICLLSLLILHNKDNCCKNCGINSWDYLIFTSALIFAPNLSIVATILNAIILIISVVIFVIWEYNYFKYPERFYPETNMNLNCKNCLKQCKFKNTH